MIGSIGLRIDGKFLELEPGTRLKIKYQNPAILRAITEGDYSFPFKIRATPYNLSVLGYHNDKNIEENFSQYSEVDVFVSGVMFTRGVLDVNFSGDLYFDASLKANISRLALYKDVKLSDLYIQEPEQLSTSNVFYTYLVNNDNIGSILQLVFDGITTFVVPVSTTVNAALLVLKSQVETYNVSPGFFPGKEILVSVSGNEITFSANWVGPNPSFFPFFSTVPGGGTFLLIDSLEPQTIYRNDWTAKMELVRSLGNYPNTSYTFFPVLNTNSKVNYNRADDSGEGDIPAFYQNYYDLIQGRFDPAKEYEPPSLPGNIRWISGITPFVFVPTILNAIGLRAGIDFSWVLLSDFVVYSNYIIDSYLEEGYTDNMLTTYFKIERTLPDVTIEQFLKTLCDTFCFALLPSSRGTSINIVSYQDLLYSSPVKDWSLKINKEHRMYAERFATGFIFDYVRDEADEYTKDAIENMSKWIFIGAYPDLASLPSVFGPANVDSFIYAYVSDTHKIYLRTPIVGSYDFQWTELVNLNPQFTIGNPDDAIEVKCADPLGTYVGPDLDTGKIWSVPLSREPISQTAVTRHKNTIKSVKFLMYHGMQPNEDAVLYPFGGSGENRLADGTQVVQLSWNMHGEYGLYYYFWRAYVNFILNTRKVELPVKLDLIDILTLDYGSRIYIDGRYYLLYDISFELPLNKEAVVTLLTIE